MNKKEMEKIYKKNIGKYEKQLTNSDVLVIKMAEKQMKPFLKYEKELVNIYNKFKLNEVEENKIKLINTLSWGSENLLLQNEFNGIICKILKNKGLANLFENVYFPTQALREWGYIKESNIMNYQLNEILKKTQNFLYEVYYETCMNIYNRVNDYRSLICEEISTENNKSKEVIIKEKNNNNIKLHEKENMRKFLKENGFEINRHNGDHAIYKNENGKTIVTPNRDIGTGLAKTIKKQIEA